MDRQKIGVAMQLGLNKHFEAHCYSNLDFFQLRSVDLPDKFENAIQLTEVKKQEIHRATAEKNKAMIELQTLKMSADYQRNVTINLAKGDSMAILSQAKANAHALKAVQASNTIGYKKIESDLKMQPNELLNFIKVAIN